MKEINQQHIPVLVKEVLDQLQPQPQQSYLDLTAGYGGHSSLIIEEIGEQAQIALVDRDENAIRYLKSKFSDSSNIEFVHSDFLEASNKLMEQGKRFDIILADLGLSSPHLDNPERGFSFMNDGPLDMRMDPSGSLTASEVLNTYSEQNIADILYNYADITSSRKLAKILVENRPFYTTDELRRVISSGHPSSNKMLARIFQALRIEVNDEINQLKQSLKIWINLLNQKGKLAVITFHSLEDRIVKDFFRENSGNNYDSKLNILTKKPISPTNSEIVHNPRARSAKLRVTQRK